MVIILAITPRQTTELPYKEPAWSGAPESDVKDYTVKVLKDGQIVGRFSLMDKPFSVIGRLDTCDIPMAHPTVSR